MEIQLPVKDQSVRAQITLPAIGRGPGILLLHAWWGLKPFFIRLCAQLAEEGFVVLAPDLNQGVIAQTVEEAMALMKRRDFDFMVDIVRAGKDFLLASPACTGDKIGVLGFSMGAAWALDLAAQAPDQVAAAVLVYGGPGVDCGKIQAAVLGHFSDVDEWEPLEGVQTLENELRTAGADVAFYIYPGLAHWFMEDDRPEYNPQAAGLAWARTLAFLKGISSLSQGAG